MTTYRSKQTIKAVQFQGQPMPGVTCDASSADKDTREAAKFANGCDSSRAHMLHVHTMATGGMTVLKPGDWVFPLVDGPFGVADDGKFRSHWEVPEPKTRPTIEELQKILDNEGDVPVIVHQDGSVSHATKDGDEILAEAGLPGLGKIRKALAVAYAPQKTLDELLAEAGLPPAEELKSALEKEAVVKSPKSPEEPELAHDSMIVPETPIEQEGA